MSFCYTTRSILSVCLLLGFATVSTGNNLEGKARFQDEQDAQSETDKEQVQKDVEEMVKAVYGADVETVLSYTHPRIIDLMGGKDVAATALEAAFASFKDLNLEVESLEFPEDPKYFKSDVNRYAFVPTLMVIKASGQRLESLNYQLGVQKIGSEEWKYVEGSRINKQNVKTFFPDFPDDIEFPETYRKRL